MAEWLAFVMLAVAVSVDSFSVGFTYGLRKLKLPIHSFIIIAICSAVFFLLAMSIGKVIQFFITPSSAEKLGGIILMLIGIWMVCQNVFAKRKKRKTDQTLFRLEIKSLGIVIQVLEKPAVADFDKSGTITGIEALILGIALSLDAIGAGVSAALLGYSPLFMSITVATMSSLFVFSGIKTGSFFSKLHWFKKFSFVPGCLLMLVGILKLA